MAFSLTDQLAKVEHDMLKAGYPASAVYLAMHNECKKFMEQERAEHYFKLYQQHYQNEKEAKLKNDQQQLSYNAASVVNHFPPETANQNAIKFVESQPNYYACVENYYGVGLVGLAGGAAAGAQQAIGRVPHYDTTLAQQQAQAHMFAQMQAEQDAKVKRDIIRMAFASDTWVDKDQIAKGKTDVVTEHVGRKFREDI